MRILNIHYVIRKNRVEVTATVITATVSRLTDSSRNDSSPHVAPITLFSRTQNSHFSETPPNDASRLRFDFLRYFCL